MGLREASNGREGGGTVGSEKAGQGSHNREVDRGGARKEEWTK